MAGLLFPLAGGLLSCSAARSGAGAGVLHLEIFLDQPLQRAAAAAWLSRGMALGAGGEIVFVIQFRTGCQFVEVITGHTTALLRCRGTLRLRAAGRSPYKSTGGRLVLVVLILEMRSVNAAAEVCLIVCRIMGPDGRGQGFHTAVQTLQRLENSVDPAGRSRVGVSGLTARAGGALGMLCAVMGRTAAAFFGLAAGALAAVHQAVELARHLFQFLRGFRGVAGPAKVAGGGGCARQTLDTLLRTLCPQAIARIKAVVLFVISRTIPAVMATPGISRVMTYAAAFRLAGFPRGH